jgi:hypothetical protein
MSALLKRWVRCASSPVPAQEESLFCAMNTPPAGACQGTPYTTCANPVKPISSKKDIGWVEHKGSISRFPMGKEK